MRYVVPIVWPTTLGGGALATELLEDVAHGVVVDGGVRSDRAGAGMPSGCPRWHGGRGGPQGTPISQMGEWSVSVGVMKRVSG